MGLHIDYYWILLSTFLIETVCNVILIKCRFMLGWPDERTLLGKCINETMNERYSDMETRVDNKCHNYNECH